MRDLFLFSSDAALAAMSDVFGEIARDLAVTVVAGTYFARGTDAAGRPTLTDRALVFGPSGGLVYEQDKAYLTEFEEAMGVSPGDPAAAHAFAVGGRRVVLTICRDTFFDAWDAAYAGADLWVDIKGNGEPYTPEVAQRFARAVPVRLRASGVAAGLTVCLTGKLLDFVWEGPSSVSRLLADGTVVEGERARSARGEEIVVADVGAP